MNITINTAEPLSETDAAILGALLGNSPAPAVSAAADAVEQTTTKRRAAKKPAAEPAPTPEPETAPEEPAADTALEPTPEENADEDLIGSAPTMQDALKKAQEMIANGDHEKIKDVLTEVAPGKRVSELEGDEIGAFLNALG